jgi:outer membrane protein assembly factor BamB
MPWLRSSALLLALTTAAGAADWPQWLGLYRDGGSPEKVATWKDPPKTLWRQPVGDGFSAPVVAEGRVFVHARVPDQEREEVLALDARTGKILWRDNYARGPFASAVGTGPRATPTVVLGKVYAFGVTGILTCYQADTGKRLWQVDVYKALGAERPKQGVCCSPLVEGNRVLVSVGGQGMGVVALDTDSGQVAWKSLSAPASTSSPVVLLRTAKDGLLTREAVFVTAQSVAAVGAADGAPAWEYPLADRSAGISPTPVVLGELILTGSMKNGVTALRISDAGGKATVKPAWKKPALTCYFATPVLATKDRLCLLTTTVSMQGPTSELRCLEAATGKELWSRGGVADYHAGLIRTADDRLLLLDDAGNLKLIDPTANDYRELCSAKVCGPTFSNPALSNGRLYVRDDKAVVCVEMK